VAPINRWLTHLAGPDRSRAVVVRTLKGALGALPAWVTSLADAVEAQGEAAVTLRRTVEHERPDAVKLARDAVAAGVVAGAPVEARWRELSGTHHVDRVKVKDGRARSTRRAGRSRGAALEALRGEVEAAATRTLVAAGARLEERLRAVLAGPGAPAGGSAVAPDPAARSAARDDAVPAAVAAWSARADAAVDGLLAGADRERAEAAVKAFDRRGTGALLLAAAAGSDDAVRLLERVLGQAAETPVAALRDDLADRAAALVEAEVRSVLDHLEAPELAGDTATGLRVRLAELRRMT
jgi:hypothetical protein